MDLERETTEQRARFRLFFSMSRTPLLTGALCRAGCFAAVLAAAVAFSPRAGLRSARERSVLAGVQAPASIIADARLVPKAGAVHRRLSPPLLRAHADESARRPDAAPRVSGAEVTASFTTPFMAARSPRPPPAHPLLVIRAS
jgi:hypothetical protein